jgi:hypothetical protein
MECLKTFTVNISAQKTITAPEAKFWGSAPQNYWVVEDPITSSTFFEVLGLQASGIGSQDLTSVNLEWQFTFVVYYKFEGED